MLDKFEVDDKGVNHVAGSLCTDTFKFQATIQTAGKEATGNPHAEKEDAGVDAVSGKQAGVRVDFLNTSGKKERRRKTGKVDRPSTLDDCNSDLLEHIYLPGLVGRSALYLKGLFILAILAK